MKRIVLFLLAFALLFTAAGCTKEPDATIQTEQSLFGDVMEQPYWDTMPDATQDSDDVEYPDETVEDGYVEYPDDTVEDDVVEYPDETVVVDPYEQMPQPDIGGTIPQTPQKTLVAEPLTWAKLNGIPIASGSMTEDQLRKICVDFMRLQLSFAWTPDKDMTYTTGGKSVTLSAGTVYGGLPYVSSTFGNLYKAMEYYDEATGTLKVQPGMGKIIGNQCSASAYWAWSRVSNAISFGGTAEMLERYGCLRVGSYTYDSSIKHLHKESIRTANICKDNGEQVMYEAYALLKPADGLSMYTGTAGHVRMVAESANVVRNGDGTINPDKSSITFLDQVADWKSEKQSNGKPIRIQGGLDVTVSFTSLYKSGYLPFRIPELAGKDPVEKAEASLNISGSKVTAQAVSGATINANYPLSDITVTVQDKSGKEVFSYTKILSALNTYSYKMSVVVMASELSSFTDGTHKISVSCRVGTGEKLVAYSGTLTK